MDGMPSMEHGTVSCPDWVGVGSYSPLAHFALRTSKQPSWIRPRWDHPVQNLVPHAPREPHKQSIKDAVLLIGCPSAFGITDTDSA